MTNLERAQPIAALPREKQAALMRQAARQTEIRSVKGTSRDRFYAHECGLSPSVIRAMRDEGHGEVIFSGSGFNSRRWHFPIELLERALELYSATHDREACDGDRRQSRDPRHEEPLHED